MKLNRALILFTSACSLAFAALTQVPTLRAETSAAVDPGTVWNEEYRSYYEVPKGDYTGRSPYMKQAKAAAPAPVVAPPPASAPAPAAKVGCSDATWGLVRMTKTMPAEASLGAEFVAQINLTAAACAGNVVVRDTYPAGASYVKSDPAAAVDGDQLVWKIGSLEAGESRTIKIWFRANKEGTLINCATVSSDPRTCAHTVVGKPALAITKTGTPEIRINETANYTIVVKSVGSAVAKNVVVTDTVPDGLTAPDGQKTITFNAGDLAPGQSKTFPVTLKAGEKRGNFCNVAVATSSNAEKVEAKACTDVVKHFLNITKTTSDKSLLIGKVASYTITVTNPGDRKQTGVVVTDTAAAGTTIVEAVGGSVAGGVATWNVGDVAPGDTKTLTVKIQSRAPGNFCNTAKVSSAQGASNTAQACSEWLGVTGVLVEMVDDPDPIPTGDVTTFTARVTNQGSTADSNDVLLKVKLPDELELVAGSASGNPTISGKTITWPAVKSLAPKATITQTWKVKGVKVGDARTILEVTTSSRSNAIEEVESTTVY